MTRVRDADSSGGPHRYTGPMHEELTLREEAGLCLMESRLSKPYRRTSAAPRPTLKDCTTEELTTRREFEERTTKPESAFTRRHSPGAYPETFIPNNTILFLRNGSSSVISVRYQQAPGRVAAFPSPKTLPYHGVLFESASDSPPVAYLILGSVIIAGNTTLAQYGGSPGLGNYVVSLNRDGSPDAVLAHGDANGIEPSHQSSGIFIIKDRHYRAEKNRLTPF